MEVGGSARDLEEVVDWYRASCGVRSEKDRSRDEEVGWVVETRKE